MTRLLEGCGVFLVMAGGLAVAQEPLGGVPAVSSTIALISPPAASATSMTVPAVHRATTMTAPVVHSGTTMIAPAAVQSATTIVSGTSVSSTVPAEAAETAPVVTGPATTGDKEKPEREEPTLFDELHKRAMLVMMPTGYAAHVHKETGENLEVFMAWYIGTFYTEQGLLIAPLFSLYIGIDAKWSFLAEKKYRPAVAVGYYGGLGLPFSGGAVRGSNLAQKDLRQTFMNNFSGALSKRFGPVRFTGGALYGLKKAFPQLLPMLRNTAFSFNKANPVSETVITAYGGFDVTFKSRHFKFEVITLPQEKENRPWLFQSRIDGFLGFDMAYLKDRFGYEIIGYYLMPFFRWPNKKRLDKEQERLLLKKNKGP